MDELDQYIDKLKSFRNEREPEKGHFKRFEQKLNRELHPQTIGLRRSMRIAAVILFILAVGFVSKNYFTSSFSNKKAISQNPDIDEISFYYTSQIESNYKKIIEDPFLDEETRNDLIKEEFKDLDSLFIQLNIEYEANPDDERVVDAMINYYRVKLNLVQEILNDLKKVKHLKNKQDENHSI